MLLACLPAPNQYDPSGIGTNGPCESFLHNQLVEIGKVCDETVRPLYRCCQSHCHRLLFTVQTLLYVNGLAEHALWKFEVSTFTSSSVQSVWLTWKTDWLTVGNWYHEMTCLSKHLLKRVKKPFTLNVVSTGPQHRMEDGESSLTNTQPHTSGLWSVITNTDLEIQMYVSYQIQLTVN